MHPSCNRAITCSITTYLELAHTPACIARKAIHHRIPADDAGRRHQKPIRVARLRLQKAQGVDFRVCHATQEDHQRHLRALLRAICSVVYIQPGSTRIHS